MTETKSLADMSFHPAGSKKTLKYAHRTTNRETDMLADERKVYSTEYVSSNAPFQPCLAA